MTARPRGHQCFNSRSPSGLRHIYPYLQKPSSSFNSRSPSGLRLSPRFGRNPYYQFQFTQPKRAAPPQSPKARDKASVSIHAAQAGCDKCIQRIKWRSNVSIHAAQAGCDLYVSLSQYADIWFQFTQPKRAATHSTTRKLPTTYCFNSRSPSGLRREGLCWCAYPRRVSIHAAQAGCDEDENSVGT